MNCLKNLFSKSCGSSGPINLDVYVIDFRDILGVFSLIQHCPASAIESVCRFSVHSFILLLLCLYSGHESTPCFMRASVGSTAPSKHSVSVLIDPTNRTALEHGEPANIGWHVELIPIRLLLSADPAGTCPCPSFSLRIRRGEEAPAI